MMTREEAVLILKNMLRGEVMPVYLPEQKRDAVRLALSALRHQIWEEQLWHDAKTDPPKTPGLYYGKKDDTNSMYPCLYRDGIWVLSAYPQTKMDIVQWADYTAFVRGDD